MPTTIKSQRLPSQPAQEWSEYTRAYGIVLNAELHAEERLAINPLGQKEKDNLIFARVTGFLLIELFDNRKILGVTPYVTLMAKITAPPLTGFTPHDLVFNLGKWHFDYFIRPCEFGSSPTSFTISFSRRSDMRQGVANSTYTRFASRLRRHGEHDRR